MKNLKFYPCNQKVCSINVPAIAGAAWHDLGLACGDKQVPDGLARIIVTTVVIIMIAYTGRMLCYYPF